MVKYFVLYAENGESEHIGPRPLSDPATIKSSVTDSFVAAAAPTIISLDGKQVATIKNGGDAIIRVTTTPIVLETNAYGSKNVRYELNVPEWRLWRSPCESKCLSAKADGLEITKSDPKKEERVWKKLLIILFSHGNGLRSGGLFAAAIGAG